MTSRAGPTILERILDGREPLLDLMNEYRAAIEQEVRDEIAATILRLPLEADRHAASWDAAIHAAAAAAISSSSATETQDDPLAVPEQLPRQGKSLWRGPTPGRNAWRGRGR